MKNVALILFFLLTLSRSYGQTAQILTGTQEVDRATKEGFYTYVNIDDAFVRQLWQKELYKYGYVEVIKTNIFQVMNARIPTITANPLTLMSKVSYDRGKTKIFMSLAQSDGTFINNSHPRTFAAEKILIDFVELLKQHQTIKTEQENITAMQDKQQKATFNSDKLNRAIESNLKEREKLMKKLEENRVEYEKLQMEVELNRREQMNINESLTTQKKKIDEVKTKITKP